MVMEALELHKRFPYAVCGHLFFLGRNDAMERSIAFGTVLGEAVALLKGITGRFRPDESAELYETIGILLLQPGDASSIDLRPTGFPDHLTAESYCERLVDAFRQRNPFLFVEPEHEPIAPSPEWTPLRAPLQLLPLRRSGQGKSRRAHVAMSGAMRGCSRAWWTSTALRALPLQVVAGHRHEREGARHLRGLAALDGPRPACSRRCPSGGTEYREAAARVGLLVVAPRAASASDRVDQACSRRRCHGTGNHKAAFSTTFTFLVLEAFLVAAEVLLALVGNRQAREQRGERGLGVVVLRIGFLNALFSQKGEDTADLRGVNHPRPGSRIGHSSARGAKFRWTARVVQSTDKRGSELVGVVKEAGQGVKVTFLRQLRNEASAWQMTGR